MNFRRYLHRFLAGVAIAAVFAGTTTWGQDEEDGRWSEIEKPAAKSTPAKAKSKGSSTKSSPAKKSSRKPKADDDDEAPVVSTKPSAPGAPPNTRASAVIVVDARSGQIFHEKNADAARPAASTQKLLTALLVAEHGFLDRKVTVTASDTLAEPTKLNIKPGETYTRIDLLRALLVKSPNDVARCLARDHSGSLEAFAVAMNERARDLGATHSNFLNPNGLPVPGQYSTARDLSLIARAAYANPTVRSIVCLPQIVFRYANGRTRELENTNKVLRMLPYCNGMKTGYTDAAGYCLIVSGSRPGRDVIAVVLGDRSRTDVRRDASALLSWGLYL